MIASQSRDDSIRIRRPLQLIHQPGFRSVAGSTAAVCILVRQPRSSQGEADAECKAYSQPGGLGASRCVRPGESERVVRALYMGAVQKQRLVALTPYPRED